MARQFADKTAVSGQTADGQETGFMTMTMERKQPISVKCITGKMRKRQTMGL